MNLWNLSLCYLRRKRGKTLTLFVVFFVIGMCLISLMSIGSSLEQKIINKQEKTVYLTASGGALWPKEAHQALQNADIVTKLEAHRIVEVSTELKLVNPQGITEQKLTVAGNAETASLSAFEEGRLRLTQGRHLTRTDHDQLLMHTELAQKNRLSVGQTIRVGGKEVTIAGLFTDEAAGGSLFPHANLVNTVLAPENLVSQISGQNGYQSLRASLNDPKMVEPLLSNIRQWPLDWSRLSAQTAREYYGDAYQNVVTLYALVSKILLQVTVFSCVALILMLSFWISNRVKETGILLAIGKSKRQVILHYLTEVLLVALAAFLLSVFAGGLLGQRLSDALMSQVNGGIASRVLHQSGLDAGRIDAVRVSIDWRDILRLYLQGSLTCIAAVVAASLSIVRLQPKQILSKMS